MLFSRLLIPWISLLLVGSPGHAEEMSLSALKAVYTLNFLNFTTGLPEDQAADAGDIGICVIGRLGIYRELEKNAQHPLVGRKVRLIRAELPGKVSDCVVIFFEEFDLARERHLLGSLQTRPILTVSDLPGFAEKGGMIELIMVDNRLRFEINLKSVRAAGLRLNPKLLKLATRILGDNRTDSGR